MIESHSTPFEIIRSTRRKRIALRVWEGKVQILAPKRFPEHDAKVFLDKNFAWVQKQLHKQANHASYQPKKYTDGEMFSYLGQNYFLTIAYAKKPVVMVRDNQLFVFIRTITDTDKRKQKIYQQLRAWYWQQAEQELQQKSQQYAQQLGVQFKSITIRQFKSRWGSCSVKGDIQYTWQIILAPHAVIDYLVVHELSHLKHHNHSMRFWQLVESVMPDYRNSKNWLKTHGHLLRIE